MAVTDNAITGTLKHVTDYTEFSSNPELQSGNYLALTLADNDFTDYESVKVGLVPTYKNGELVNDDSGLVEIINDPDKNGVFYIKSNSQKFVIKTADNRQEYSLTGLTLQDE